MALLKDIAEIFPQPPADVEVGDLDIARIPTHIAVIMDGNGRWAKSRGWQRLRGHKAGIQAVRETIRTAHDLGVRYLTIYSFSSENWQRPEEEVTGLMDLFAKTMLAEVDELHAEGVRIMTIGRTNALPEKTRAAFEKAYDMTRANTGMTLIIAVNYGGRAEISDAVGRIYAPVFDELTEAATNEKLSRNELADFLRALADQTKRGEAPFLDIPLSDEGSGDAPKPGAPHTDVPTIAAAINDRLDTAGIPDPDLVIRTSGELRVSNFLLWQIAYSEWVITPCLWPDFDRYELLRALIAFQGRQRRFGGV